MALLNPELQLQQRRFERILVAVFVLTLPLMNPWVRGDGVGYYAYARAPLIEHNLDFTHDYQSANESFREARCDENGQPRQDFRTRTGHLENHFSVGPAMLWSPFLLMAHGGVLLVRELGSSVAADGFSAPYRYAMAFGTCLYGFLSLLFSFRLACKYVGPAWSFLATLAIWWASSLPVYMYFNPSWSHAHSAFVVGVFLWYWDATRDQRNLAQWLLLGLIVGLMLDVYFTNLMAVSVLAVEAVQQYVHVLASRRSSSPNFLELLSRYLAFGLVVCIVMIPTFLSRWIVYGGPFESGYVSIRDYLWRSPACLSVLFSSNHGLLVWTPLLGLAILGLFFFAFRLPKVGMPFLAALVAFYFFISVYPDWAGISSYGNRFFVSLTALFIVGLSVFLDRVVQLFRSPKAALAAASAALAIFVLWNAGLMFQWGLRLIPARGPVEFSEMIHNQFFVVPRRLTTDLHAYLYHRKALMQKIENHDLQQLKENLPPQ